MNHVQEIIKLEAEAEKLADQQAATAAKYEQNRWRTAELIYAELQTGKTQQQLADEIDKGRTHVVYMNAVWTRHLGDTPEDRPRFNEAYQAAKDHVTVEERHAQLAVKAAIVKLIKDNPTAGHNTIARMAKEAGYQADHHKIERYCRESVINCRHGKPKATPPPPPPTPEERAAKIKALEEWMPPPKPEKPTAADRVLAGASTQGAPPPSSTQTRKRNPLDQWMAKNLIDLRKRAQDDTISLLPYAEPVDDQTLEYWITELGHTITALSWLREGLQKALDKRKHETG